MGLFEVILSLCRADGLLQMLWIYRGFMGQCGAAGACRGQCGVVKVSLRLKEMNDHLVLVRDCSAVPLSSVSSVYNPQFP